MKDDIKKIIERLTILEKRLFKMERKVTSEASIKTTGSENLSLKEFLLLKRPTNDVKKTLAVGYYLGKYKNFDLFNVNDLEAAFEHAKEKKPINMNDKINMNIRNGHFEEASEKKNNRKAWYFTNSGEIFIENNFKSKAKG